MNFNDDILGFYDGKRLDSHFWVATLFVVSSGTGIQQFHSAARGSVN
jgi:hypothetical protein